MFDPRKLETLLSQLRSILDGVDPKEIRRTSVYWVRVTDALHEYGFADLHPTADEDDNSILGM